MSDLTLKDLQNLNFFITLPDGTVFNDTLGFADLVLHEYQGTTCILGVAFGVVITLSVLLILVARNYKSVMFCLYQSNFIWALISYSIILREYMEPAHNITANYFGLPSPPSSARLATGGSFASFFLVVSLLASISFQVFTAYKNVDSLAIKLTVAIIVSLAAFQTLFVWIWSLTLVVRAQNEPGTWTHSWSNNALWPSFAASTLVCSLILSIRLYAIVRSRTKLGLEKFDTVKVILIVALQNATIPSFFGLFYAIFGKSTAFPEAIGLLTTLLCCTFFPMGYIWAQAYAKPLYPKTPSQTLQNNNNDVELRINSTSYWNGGLPTGTSEEFGEYALDKEGNRFRTHEIK